MPETPEFEDGMMNKAGYGPFVMTMAIIGGIGAHIAVCATKRKIPDLRRYENDERTHWTQTFAQIKIAAQIRPFLWLCGGYCCVLILCGASSALSFYHGGYLWKFTQVQKFFVALAPMFMLIPAVILSGALAKWLDKKPAICIFALIYFIGGVLPYCAYAVGAAPAAGSDALLALVMGLNCAAFTGLFGVLVIANSMLADLVDVMEQRTGKRQEGVWSAAFSFAQKLTFIFGTLIASVSLILIGFPKQTDPSQVPQRVIGGLASASIVMGIVLTAFALACFLRYGLSRADIAAIQAEVTAKR